MAARTDGKGKALRQVVLKKGIEWQPMPEPETVLGDRNWSDQVVRVDALIEQAGFVRLFGRVGVLQQNAEPIAAYSLTLYDTGAWELKAVKTLLAHGHVSGSANTWHALELAIRAKTIEGKIDGAQVARVEDETFGAGMAGLGCGWHGAQFDNFEVRATAPEPIPVKAATASSVWSDDYAADKACDADLGTRWNAARGHLAGEWVELDFGHAVRFDRVDVSQFMTRIQKYTLLIKDGEKWAEIASGDATGRPLDRHVRASRVTAPALADRHRRG